MENGDWSERSNEENDTLDALADALDAVGLWRARAERLRGQLAELRRVLDAERAHRDVLERMIVELRRDGFAPPPRLELMPTAQPLPDKVMGALMERAQPGSALWRQLAGEAVPLLSTGMPEEEVAHRILVGMPDPDALLE